MKTMIEVFKTNISSAKEAGRIVAEIQQAFTGYRVNFDLADCDNILRVDCEAEHFCVGNFIQWLMAKGCIAALLPD